MIHRIILSSLILSLAFFGLANPSAWSDEQNAGPESGAQQVAQGVPPQRGGEGRPAPAVSDENKERARQKAELETTLRSLLEKAAQTERLIKQIEEKAEHQTAHRTPPVKEPIQLRQDKPAITVIRFNHISAGSFVKTLEQLARNPKVAEAIKEMPWALNEEANAVVVIAPPAAAEMLTEMAKELDQPSQYHKPVQHEAAKVNLPLPAGPFNIPVMPGMPGAGMTSPMQPGAVCPMKPGAPCPMQPGCPMQGMKTAPSHPALPQVQPGAKVMPGMKIGPGSTEPVQPKIAQPAQADVKVTELIEQIEAVLKNQANPKIIGLLKALEAAIREQAGHGQILILEAEKHEKQPPANQGKPAGQGRFRIMLQTDDNDNAD